MQTARVTTIAPEGLSGRLITVEVAARPGVSSLKIVGLAGRTVAEAKERVRVALRSCGVRLPATNIVINLAPAEIAKTGTHYDLPIALGLMIATGLIPDRSLDNVAVAAELALNGDLRPYQHGPTIAFAAEQLGYRLLTDLESVSAVRLAQNLLVATSPNLRDVMQGLRTGQLEYVTPPASTEPVRLNESHLEDLVGLAQPKRALTLAIAGHHHLLLCGPPGVGKSLLANTAASLMPEPVETTQRLQAALHGQPLDQPPFRSPHHSATATALLGGGNALRPGEISLAHGGVLFLDELPRFSSPVLQSLLEPLESGQINLSRDGRSVTYPASPLVIGAYNPCPCGFYGDAKTACQCTAAALEHYRSRLSGPLISRFSLFASCQSSQSANTLTTASARQIIATTQAQIVRRGQTMPNGLAPTKLVREWLAEAKLGRSVNLLLQAGRSWRSIINAGRLARTIADTKSCSDIDSESFAEAIGWLPPQQIVT